MLWQQLGAFKHPHLTSPPTPRLQLTTDKLTIKLASISNVSPCGCAHYGFQSQTDTLQLFRIREIPCLNRGPKIEYRDKDFLWIFLVIAVISHILPDSLFAGRRIIWCYSLNRAIKVSFNETKLNNLCGMLFLFRTNYLLREQMIRLTTHKSIIKSSYRSLSFAY